MGTGNAFADGGRSHACIHLSSPGTSLLLDCGGSSLPALKSSGIDLGAIDAIAISHLHGDHFGGLPYFVIEQHFKGRTRPLIVAGPAALERLVWSVLDALYADFRARHVLGYRLSFVTLGRLPVALGGASVSAHPVRHIAEADPHGIRVELGGVTVAYSGDAAWSDALPALAEGSDLFVCDCTGFEKVDPSHLTYREIVAHRTELRTKRLLLTHLGADSLAHLKDIEYEYATDGLVLELSPSSRPKDAPGS